MAPGIWLSVALLANSVAGAAAPQAPATWQPQFSFHFENDSLPGAGTDDSYTQGLELRVRRGEGWRLLEPLLRTLWTKEPNDMFERTASAVLGQTILTPHNVITYTPSRRDRPFAGFLYAGIEASRIREEKFPVNEGTPEERTLGRERLSVVATLGVVGPLAGGRDAQSGVHILRENRMAKGWLVSQLGNQPQINIRLVRDRMPVRIADNADFTVTEEVTLGTTQTYAGIGGTARIGRGLSSFPSGVIAYSSSSTPLRRFELAAQASARWRFMAHNAFVGGLLGRPGGLKTERSVVDLGAGVEARWKAWRFSYMVVRRTKEFSPLPPGVPEKHRFVALNLSREHWSEDPSECLDWLKDGLRFNFRLGRASSSVAPAFHAAHTPPLAAGLGIEHSLGSGRFSVGYETTSTAREAGPPTPGQPTHEDLFLIAKAVTVGWEPTRVTSRHKLQIRAGGGLATAKLQITPDTGALLEPEPVDIIEKGRSLVAGARYSYRLGRPLSLTADVTAARLLVNRQIVRRADFVGFALGVQIHPWDRDASAKSR